MNLDLCDSPSTHWTNPPSDATGINRHRITSRGVVRTILTKKERVDSRRWRYNIAARIAAVYDLFLGRETPKPLLVERSRPDVQRVTD
jgi:hypothetical protein